MHTFVHLPLLVPLLPQDPGKLFSPPAPEGTPCAAPAPGASPLPRLLACRQLLGQSHLTAWRPELAPRAPPETAEPLSRVHKDLYSQRIRAPATLGPVATALWFSKARPYPGRWRGHLGASQEGSNKGSLLSRQHSLNSMLLVLKGSRAREDKVSVPERLRLRQKAWDPCP